jgi:hypothetical protein
MVEALVARGGRLGNSGSRGWSLVAVAREDRGPVGGQLRCASPRAARTARLRLEARTRDWIAFVAWTFIIGPPWAFSRNLATTPARSPGTAAGSEARRGGCRPQSATGPWNRLAGRSLAVAAVRDALADVGADGCAEGAKQRRSNEAAACCGANRTETRATDAAAYEPPVSHRACAPLRLRRFERLRLRLDLANLLRDEDDADGQPDQGASGGETRPRGAST